MRSLNIKRIRTSIIASIVSFPLAVLMVSMLWKYGIFDFGTSLSQLEFIEVINQVYVNVFPEIAIEFIMFGLYIYFAWYKNLKKCGIEQIDIFVIKVKKELMIAYVILVLVIAFGSLFSTFASLFIPLLLMILIPFTVFVLFMEISKKSVIS